MSSSSPTDFVPKILQRRTSDATTLAPSRRPSLTSSGSLKGPASILTRVSSLRSDVTLASILAGETCSPIGFKDLELFLSHKEYSSENLQFIVWLRSYQRRFLALPEHVRRRAPRPLAKNDRWNPGESRREWEKARGLLVDADGTGSGGTAASLPAQGTRYSVEIDEKGLVDVKRAGFQTCAWTKEGAHCTFDAHAVTGKTDKAEQIHAVHCSNARHSHPTSGAVEYTTSCDPDDDGLMPLVEECRRAHATFIKAGAIKELNLEDCVRERVTRDLATSTHPDVWLPAYESIYVLVESHSLNHFLIAASQNINLPKQLFWWAVGLTDLAISILLLLLFVFLLPSRPFGWRTIRLFSVLFASFGAMQTYSAARGFCTQVWGRSSRQLYPWEMAAMDAEDEELTIGVASAYSSLDPPRKIYAAPAIERILSSSAITLHHTPEIGSPTDLSPAPSSSSPPRPAPSTPMPWETLDLSSPSSPLPDPSDSSRPPKPVRRPSMPAWDASFEHEEKEGQHKLATRKRPPVFGPEVVIDDPRVVALHKAIVRDILIVGGGWALIWTTICLAIP